jgi:hypothetical protein
MVKVGFNYPSGGRTCMLVDGILLICVQQVFNDNSLTTHIARGILTELKYRLWRGRAEIQDCL